MKKKLRDQFFIFDRPVEQNFAYKIKKGFLPIRDFIYDLVISMSQPKLETTKKDFVVCAIFKDEGRSLKEWVEYHLIVGVEHFYLYNNFSTDNYIEILQEYIDTGIVTLIDWPVEKGQYPAYKHFWENYRNISKWVTFIDLDEFICPHFEDTIVDWLRPYEKYPSVIMYWKMFGTSGKLEHDDDTLVIEQYTVSWDKMDTVGKVIINTSWDLSIDSIWHHHAYCKVPFLGKTFFVPPVNEFKKFICYDIHRANSKGFTIQLNHYWSKSYNEMVLKKFERGDVFFGDEKPTLNLESFYYHEKKNISSDYTIFRYLIRLKTALGFDALSRGGIE